MLPVLRAGVGAFTIYEIRRPSWTDRLARLNKTERSPSWAAVHLDVPASDHARSLGGKIDHEIGHLGRLATLLQALVPGGRFATRGISSGRPAMALGA
jgi:hypothetical protein